MLRADIKKLNQGDVVQVKGANEIKPTLERDGMYLRHKIIRYAGRSLNWNSEMDSFIGKMVSVDSIYEEDGIIQIVYNNKRWRMAYDWVRLPSELASTDPANISIQKTPKEELAELSELKNKLAFKMAELDKENEALSKKIEDLKKQKFFNNWSGDDVLKHMIEHASPKIVKNAISVNKNYKIDLKPTSDDKALAGTVGEYHVKVFFSKEDLFPTCDCPDSVYRERRWCKHVISGLASYFNINIESSSLL